MYSYLVYAGISHVNQLTKIHPALISRVRSELDEIARQFGACQIEKELHHFPQSLGELARKTAEAASAMFACLRRHERELYGITVLISAVPEDEIPSSMADLEDLLLKVPDVDGFWVADDALSDFDNYLEGAVEDGMFRVKALKEFGPRFEERLSRLLIRSGRLEKVHQALKKLEKDENDGSILLLHGPIGSGKRAVLNHALRMLYPDDGGSPLTIPFAEDAEDPQEPFIRALDASMAVTMEYFDADEKLWWEREGADFLEMARTGHIWETFRDQGPVDLIQAFALFVKAHVKRRRQVGSSAYVIIDGFTPESEAATWLRSLLTEFLGTESFRLVVIRDSDDFDEVLPISGVGQKFVFRQPSRSEWASIVQKASLENTVEAKDLKELANYCGANLYRLFHCLIARERDLDSRADPVVALVASLEWETRRLLFLAHVSDGLVDRRILVERLNGDASVRNSEDARYQSLLELGLIREDSDGRVRSFPCGLVNVFAHDVDFLQDAHQFGEYLYSRYQEGGSIDLFRLFRYLESWGPNLRGIAVLHELLSTLLTNRRLRAAGKILSSSPMTVNDLDVSGMESIQNVLGAARLRYVLLTEGIKGARNLVRAGTVSLAGGSGSYSDSFRLHNAQYFYAMERWDDALVAAKEALFIFQRSGDHKGEAYSHLELALSLLAQRKVRDAMEHFEISRRIGTQVKASWAVLRASALAATTQFIYGNLPWSLRECYKYRVRAQHAGRRDLWLLFTLTIVRINWELGRYEDGAAVAEEGRELAAFYDLEDPRQVLSIWKGRCLLANDDVAGYSLLTADENSRESLAFLAEIAYLKGDLATAYKHIQKALVLPRKSCRLQGEADDWSDGFFPIEGRLSDSQGLLDVLGEWIEGFDSFLAVESGDATQIVRLDALLEKNSRGTPRPFSYMYAYWAALMSPLTDRGIQTRYMRLAFNDFYVRAGRFDDAQIKHEWLTANPWNKRIMAEAQKQQFL